MAASRSSSQDLRSQSLATRTIAGLPIAAAKATLIVLFFMHVRYGSPLVRLFAMSGFVWLIILFAFVAADVLTRNWAG